MDVLSLFETENREFLLGKDNFIMSVYDKKRLKLDLTSKVKKQDNNNAVLTSPDLIKLKLDSPELERIILATAGSATPTPKQYRRMKGSSDLTVREQQEQYVRGFEDALNKMREESNISQRNNDMNASTVGALISNNNNIIPKMNEENEMSLKQQINGANTLVKRSSHVPSTTYQSSSYVNTNNGFQAPKCPVDFPLNTAINSHVGTADNTNSVIRVKTNCNEQQEDDITADQLLYDPVESSNSELQCKSSQLSNVPTTSHTSSFSTVPIDLHKQEEVKTERKKHRNRVAASKCRKRKLERESHLQEAVNELKCRHTELSNIASILRQQVCDLKLQVMDHIKSGCEVLPIAAT